MVPQDMHGTNNFLDTNVMKQTPSHTSEFLLSWSKNSPILRDMTGSSECSFQFADTDMHCFFSVKWYDYHHKQQGISHCLICSST
jgi:hypothetical protein